MRNGDVQRCASSIDDVGDAAAGDQRQIPVCGCGAAIEEGDELLVGTRQGYGVMDPLEANQIAGWSVMSHW